MKVLLIEQDLQAGQLYHEALKAKGFKVQLVATAQQALYVLDSTLPNCIVLELDLKMHNGFEFLYEFCSQDDWKHLPIIVHTTIPMRRLEKFIVSWEELNVVSYLYKPTSTLSELQDAVMSASSSRVN